MKSTTNGHGHNNLIKNSVDIITVNWNAGRQLHDCLSSIVVNRCNAATLNRVIVVDNASSDDSLSGLESLELPLGIVRNTENKGFAAACNQGARTGTSEYLLFLNPDTIMDDMSLDVPIEFMARKENSGVGIVGIQLVDESGIVSRTCTRFPTPLMVFFAITGLDKLFPERFMSYFMSEWGHGESRQVDHVIGAFYLVRRSLFEALDGFDERFFVYLEDLDFSYRTRSAGWSCYFLAEAKAFHKGGGTSDQVKARRLFYSLRSRILYGYKHFNRGVAFLLMLGTLFLEPLIRLAMCAVRCSGTQALETVHGYAMLWMSAGSIMKSAFRKSAL